LEKLRALFLLTEKFQCFRSDFLAIPELENNPLGERIVQAFFQDSQEVRYAKVHLGK